MQSLNGGLTFHRVLLLDLMTDLIPTDAENFCTTNYRIITVITILNWAVCNLVVVVFICILLCSAVCRIWIAIY